MGLVRPDLPDLDAAVWRDQPESERVRAMCESWAVQGFGAPLVAYLFYLAKVAGWIALWVVFVARAPGIEGWSDLGTWWADPIALQKAAIWTLAFEVLGLGCGSGPLTGRYVPPVAAPAHFLRPGTIRLPAFPRHVPLTAGSRRSVVDALGYLALLVLAGRALWAPEVGAAELAPIVVLLPLLGLRDKTIFLAARAEQYWSLAVVALVAGDDVRVFLAGAMLVQVVIWWGAATSKLNRHFPNVITVMVSNSPVLRPAWLRRRVYRDWPSDLRPAPVAHWLAHGGTALEYTFPLVLLLSSGGTTTTLALIAMAAFHVFITSCFPMGVPIEWNVFVVYAGFALFGVHADVSPAEVTGAPVLVVLLVAGVLVGPVLGNLRPDLVSFLPAMRYYAGNWSASLWLFRGDAQDRLDDHVVKAARTVRHQLAMLYDDDAVQLLQGKTRAFRSMHLHGRALNAVLATAIDDLDDYEVAEGEVTCGVLLGWNFGDGHLHQDQLLAAVQERCGFAPREVLVVALESQPLGGATMRWRVVDAADGVIADGEVVAADLVDEQPWPTSTGTPSAT